ncbi:Protein of unknown function [Micromonospora phaseoli]|uniref:DUF4240 domain-containing protein n=1 Tax=Micromonospora phaseoli TaxID=1144548 RepID=A0A1H7CTR9_9ACTN|nr:DUF4240 domain-containing protein [Micromonospora phaseoli]PZV97776.1 uncharacterized protein DUF4240 [Micromonospora phaseoli]GIJ78488.1 hypothetical protein Xph01_29200 [Micromonospora phaseoli]SEJ89225.1 Protein of unknown function [Micromonospora phaseoli]
MRTEDFWQLIDRARSGGGEPDDIAVRAVALLAERDPEEIVGYAEHQRRVLAASYRVDLWGAAYLINGGASDDGFEYFRGWLMAQGREVFARAVADPDSLAELPAVRAASLSGEEFECEDMLGVPWDAYRKATASDLPADRGVAPEPDLNDFWDFDDSDEARRRLPRLAALFAEPPQE